MKRTDIKEVIAEFYHERDKNGMGNKVIIERLKNLMKSNDSAHDRMTGHLEKLNGKVNKHEIFNAKLKVYLSIAGGIFITFFTAIISNII